MRKWLERRWYHGSAPLFLRPLSALYASIAAARAERAAGEVASLSVSVIVVGNIAVGGTGKTPFVIWLVQRLREWGFTPGVVSRGYGGRARTWPQRVTPSSDPAQVGDEPVLIATRLGCPLYVAPDRVAAAQELLRAHREVDVLVSDDGLQHYRLPRDLEICMVDGRRGFGNGWRLPAGPLREAVERLDTVDLVVVNGGSLQPPCRVPTIRTQIAIDEAVHCLTSERRPLAWFAGRRVHAVAGIGDPARFFSALARFGVEQVMHPFADHHAFRARDLAFGDDAPVLLTEKDAVKCRALRDDRLWMVPARLELGAEDLWTVRKSVQVMRLRRQEQPISASIP